MDWRMSCRCHQFPHELSLLSMLSRCTWMTFRKRETEEVDSLDSLESVIELTKWVVCCPEPLSLCSITIIVPSNTLDRTDHRWPTAILCAHRTKPLFKVNSPTLCHLAQSKWWTVNKMNVFFFLVSLPFEVPSNSSAPMPAAVTRASAVFMSL